jgi:hypothetical protein
MRPRESEVFEVRCLRGILIERRRAIADRSIERRRVIAGAGSSMARSQTCTYTCALGLTRPECMTAGDESAGAVRSRGRSRTWTCTSTFTRPCPAAIASRGDVDLRQCRDRRRISCANVSCARSSSTSTSMSKSSASSVDATRSRRGTADSTSFTARDDTRPCRSHIIDDGRAYRRVDRMCSTIRGRTDRASPTTHVMARISSTMHARDRGLARALAGARLSATPTSVAARRGSTRPR